MAHDFDRCNVGHRVSRYKLVILKLKLAPL